jgi:hypothetical protein
MTIKQLYRWQDGNSIVVSPIKPDKEFTITYRVCAEPDSEITNGNITGLCFDTDNPNEWHDVLSIDQNDDYKTALQILLGVEDGDLQ